MAGKKDDNAEDMTMEEILASIRKYVTDDGGEESQGTPAPEDGSVIVPPPGAHFESEEEDEDPLELGEPIDSSPYQNVRQPQRATASQPQHRESIPSARPSVRPQQQASAALRGQRPSSAGMAQAGYSQQQPGRTAASAALSQLSQVAQAHQPVSQESPQQTVDQLFLELARPMVQAWLDRHLPGLVEEMVAREIDRIKRSS